MTKAAPLVELRQPPMAQARHAAVSGGSGGDDCLCLVIGTAEQLGERRGAV
ncbi:hypothetical protein O4H61_17240 [Roseovarius aestuarii]|nr:hypothetical protein [Roseovarius aestuarii]